MKRYVFTGEDRAKGHQTRAYQQEGRESARLRRMAELALLDRLRAEAAKPELYPER